MVVDSNTNNDNNNSSTSRTPTQTKSTQPPIQPTSSLECIPLLDYITNIMKFVEAILSNNSTDDHCKEFVKQKGLVPLLQILSLPNLPIDFPSSTACQSVAQVCKAILHLAREQQVIDQALNSLAEALTKCEQLYFSYKTVDSKLSTSSPASSTTSSNSSTLLDGSVLIRELAQAENPLDAVNCPTQTPLLHSICSIHSFIYLLITLGKINQNDVRNITINKWGSDLGGKVLKDLCKLYMNLIWESSMLLWLCNEEQQQNQLQQLQQFYQLQLAQIQDVTLGQQASTLNNQLSQLIQQFSQSATSFEFNRNDLDRLRNYLNNTTAVAAVATQLPPPPPPPTSTTPSITTETTQTTNTVETMETLETPITTTPKIQEPAQTQFQTTMPVSYSKLLRPLFNCSSKLGRSLCELFGLLVKLSAGSPWKNANARRNMIHHMHNNSNNLAPSQAAINVASAIADISISGFSQQRFSFTDLNSKLLNNATSPKQQESLHPKFRLTFYICSIGFASSILFDEQKRPYHLMLQRFDQSGGLKSLFDAFHWSLSLLNNNSSNSNTSTTTTTTTTTSSDEQQDRDKLQEGTLEFIEAWLNLIQKLVNTKNMLETRHSLGPAANTTYTNPPASGVDIKKVCSFDPIKFLFKVHKESFQALMCLWDNKSFIIRENYSLSETVLNILCQILVGDSQLQKKLAEQQTQQQQQTSLASSNLASSLRTSIQNVRDARAQFLAAMQDVNNLPATVSSNSNINTVAPSSSTNNEQTSTSLPTRQLTQVDQDLIEQMISMGFSPELAHEAVLRSPPDSLEQAVDYCFNHPNTGSTSTAVAATTTTTTPVDSASNTNPEQSSSTSAAATAQAIVETSIDQVILEAINVATTTATTTTNANIITDTDESMPTIPVQQRTIKPLPTTTTAAASKEQTTPGQSDSLDDNHQLDKAILDKFVNNMLPGLMKILDNVPDTVYRVCDLIVVVVRKYGSEWRDDCLSFMLKEMCDLIREVCNIYNNKSNNKLNRDDPMISDDPMTSTNTTTNNKNVVNNAFLEQKLASRLLLFCLLFEEMQLPCAKIVNSSNLLDKLVCMLQMVTINSNKQQQQQQPQQNKQPSDTNLITPVWLTSLFILVDLIEKAALATKRKAAINDNFQQHQRIWKWYEERQNRWIQYAYANNKTIDTAYKNGETSVRIVASRKHYVIHFNTMLQENEETLHKRPIMLSFEKPTVVPTAPLTTTTTATTNTDNSDTTNAEMINNPSDIFPSTTNTTSTTTTTSSSTATIAAAAAATTTSTSRPSSPLPTEVVNGLQPFQTSAVIESCVELVSWPVSDPDCLHAILRLILRLTRQYEYAIEFAARRGPQHILNLTQRNSFMGYASLITLIFRHICEDEKNLRLTMEKAIRLALSGSQINIAGLQPGGIGSRELHNVLRLLGPAICRHPDLFCEVAVDILRIIIRREDENSLLNTNNINNLQQIIQQPLSNSTAYCLRTVMAKLMPPTPMPDYARILVVDLLNYLIKPLTDNSNSANKFVNQANKLNEGSKTESNKFSKSNSSSLIQPNSSTNTIPPIQTQQPLPLISKSGVLRILSELGMFYYLLI